MNDPPTWEARQDSPLQVEGQTYEEFQNYLLTGKERWPETLIFGARQGLDLLGWLGVITTDP